LPRSSWAARSAPPIDPSQLRTLLKLKPGDPIPQRAGGRLTPGPAFTAGWHLETCVNNYFAEVGSKLIVFAVNRDGTFFFDSSNSPDRVKDIETSAQFILKLACKSTNYYVHVIDPTALTFDEILLQN
jgi:hypothetical protein